MGRVKRVRDSTSTAIGRVDKKLKEATSSSDDENSDAPSPPSSSPYNSALIQVDPHTPPNANQPRNGTPLQTPLSNSTNASIFHVHSPGGSGQMIEAGSGVSVDLEVGDGEYVLKIKRRSVPSSSSDEHKAEETKQLAQSAGLLFLQAEILRDMGEQLLAQFRASLQYAMGKSASTISLTHQ